MSLAAALKKGLETADTIGKWDPFADEGAAPAKGPANTNATARALTARDAPKPAVAPRNPAPRNPIAAVRGSAKVDLASLEAEDKATRPAQRGAAYPGRPAQTAAPKPAAKQAPAKANWLHDSVSGGRVNAAQYVRELDRFAAEEARRAVADMVMDVNPGEVEGVVRHAARIKGRYLAKLLDIGNKAKAGVMEAEISELTRYRETYEELARGLDILKTAIEAGDISVSGTVRR